MTESLSKALRAAAGNVGGGGGTAWDLDNAQWLGSPIYANMAATSPNSYGVSFSSDGTKMYLVRASSNDIHTYTLSTAWDPRTATYSSSLDLQALAGEGTSISCRAMRFKSDGTKMYLQESTQDVILEFPLSTAWDLSTITSWPGLQTFSVATEETNPCGLFFNTDGTKMYVSGYTGDDVNQYALTTAWDLSTATYEKNFSMAAQDGTIQGLFFSADGTRMYSTGTTNDRVYQYALSTAWDVGTASYVQYYSVSGAPASATAPAGVYFSADGTRMYVVCYASDDVHQYSLSTAWDISTASYVQSKYVNVDNDAPQDVFFKPDGTVMYVIGEDLRTFDQYSLSTAWDISTASKVYTASMGLYDTYPTGCYFSPDGIIVFIVGRTDDAVWRLKLNTAWDLSDGWDYGGLYIRGQETGLEGFDISTDGTKVYAIGTTGDDINEYTLSTAWDMRSGTYVQSFSVSAQDSSPVSVNVSSDGYRLFVMGQLNDSIYQYNLTTAYDVSTASYAITLDFGEYETTPEGFTTSADGKYFYIVGLDLDYVHRFTLNTAWDLSSVDWRSFYVGSEETTPRPVCFSPDGTRMYVSGAVGDDFNQYSLSTAWDVTTASYVANFSFAAYEDIVYGMYISPTGTDIYITASSDNVRRFTLSTAWDITTASYVSLFYIGTQETSPYGLFFSDNGVYLYVIGAAGDDINRYELSTAWDITTASFLEATSVAGQTTSPCSMFIGDSGTKLFVSEYNTSPSYVFQYNLTTPWDTSTLVNSTKYFDSTEIDTQAGKWGLWFKSDGTKMYICGNGYDRVYAVDM